MTITKSKLESYHSHLTTEYDEEFRKVEDLLWDPWVGNNYHKTGILVLGMSTDMRDGEDWTKNIPPPLTSRDASRVLVTWIYSKNDVLFDHARERHAKSFCQMAKIFIEGADAQYNVETSAAFWGSVAFNNYYQIVVENMGDIPGPEYIEKSKRALYKTINIIKPKLILAWTTDPKIFWLGHRRGVQKIGRVTPFVVVQEQLEYSAPIIGMSHTSRINRSACLEFLQADPVSKEPIEDFLQHLTGATFYSKPKPANSQPPTSSPTCKASPLSR